MMNGLGRRLAVTFTAIALAVFGAATTAGAANTQSTRMQTAAVGTGAGYIAYPSDFDGIASVGATFTVPATSCQRTTDKEWLLPGIWVFTAEGTLTQQVAVNVDCNNGILDRYTGICVTGTCKADLPVFAGDVIEASLVYTAKNTVGTIRDRTRGTSSQVVGVVDDSDSTVFIGALGPSLSVSEVTRVPTFTSVPFSSVQINGQYLDDWAPARFNLKTAKAVQIKTGAITRDQGFKLEFAHN